MNQIFHTWASWVIQVNMKVAVLIIGDNSFHFSVFFTRISIPKMAFPDPEY